MEKPELIYFPCFGRGGMAKILFHLADIDFEDTIMPWDDWKDKKETMPLGGLPVLKIDGQTFCQTKAINKYLAKKAGLLGTTDIEQLKVDMLMESRQEFLEKTMFSAFPIVCKEFPTDPSGVPLAGVVLLDPSPENRINRAKRFGALSASMGVENAKSFETLLEKYQTNPEFCVGDSMTVADLDLLSWYIMSKDMYLGFDFAATVPISNRIVMGLLKNPKIAKFLDKWEATGLPYTGMGPAY